MNRLAGRLTRITAAVLFCLAPHSVAAAECTARVQPGQPVQARIDALDAHEAPRTLCLAAGEYRLKSFLWIDGDDFTLRGEGPDTVLRLAEGVQSPLIVIGDHRHENPPRTVRDVVVENLRIIGGGEQGSELHAKYPYLRNSAVIVRNGERITLRGLQVSDCRSACILTEYNSRLISIVGNTVRGAVWDGISLNRGERTVIRDNLLEGNVAAGITTEFLKDSLIEGNRFVRNGSHGVYLADAYHNKFRDNRFENNAGAGVYLTCSIRFRDPILCWDNSMSQANVFENNEYIDNGYGYLLGVDSAANCTKPDFEVNLSRNERFRNSENNEPDWNTYGYCLRYEGSRTE